MRDVAVVTGGSAGIGLAAAERLARSGRAVAILAREPARLEEAAGMLRRLGNPVLAIPADVADAAAVDAAAERVERDLGPIGAWVNNAMSTVVAPADRITPEEYRRVTDTTYLSQVYGTLAALRHMRPRGRGAIVQVSSGLGIRAAALQAPYCAAKFAVSGFTDALRTELIADGVKVSLTVVYLPAVNTPQFGWARNRTGHDQEAPDPIFDPRLAAEAIHFAVENPRREIWVGRSTVMMAIAQALAPALADRQASSFKEQQLGDPMGYRPGNLEEAPPGPARMDGRFGDRVKAARHEFFTSRQRDAAKLGGLGLLAALGAVGATSVLRGARRLLR